jgi:hypothetical protein
MPVDRPAARVSWPVRALVWAAALIGCGLVVLAVQQLLAEPAGADTPGPIDGVVGTAEQVVDPPVSAVTSSSVASSSVASSAAALEPLAPVVEALAPVAEPLIPTVEAAPVLEATAPVVAAATPVVAPLAEAANPLADAAAPVVDAITPALTPVVEAVAPVVTPVVDAVLGAVPDPSADRSDLTRSSPGDTGRPGTAAAQASSLPIGARAPLPVPGPRSVMERQGDVAVAMLISMGGGATGGRPAAGGVPPGPLALAVSPVLPGGLGGPAFGGGAGPSVLVAVLAGGVPGLGLTRGGVVHDRAARLIGLVHAPGRLPG